MAIEGVKMFLPKLGMQVDTDMRVCSLINREDWTWNQ